jgi:DNA replication and repair protein RecF
MPLTSLVIDRFRNLEPVELQLSPRINLFVGANAAGKTSVLEAIHVLARARSFRSRDLDKLIQRGADEFQLRATVQHGRRSDIPVGLRRAGNRLVARIDGKTVTRLSDLAALFPIHWLGGRLHQLVEEGPVFRRQYLDWGLFHVKPNYSVVWKRYRKLLKQRNAALRARRPRSEVVAWNTELAIAGEELNRLRSQYLARLQPLVNSSSDALLGTGHSVMIQYRQGWPGELDLGATLEAGFDRDREQGHTGRGPHRADLVFLADQRPVGEQLSRGQQKLFVIALQVAQARLLSDETGQTSLFLLDDLGAELDAENQARVIRLLAGTGAQVFITAIEMPEESGWSEQAVKRFHVERGKVSEVV